MNFCHNANDLRHFAVKTVNSNLGSRHAGFHEFASFYSSEIIYGDQRHLMTVSRLFKSNQMLGLIHRTFKSHDR